VFCLMVQTTPKPSVMIMGLKDVLTMGHDTGSKRCVNNGS
jgi:hypothetical protein